MLEGGPFKKGDELVSLFSRAPIGVSGEVLGIRLQVLCLPGLCSTPSSHPGLGGSGAEQGLSLNPGTSQSGVGHGLSLNLDAPHHGIW